MNHFDQKQRFETRLLATAALLVCLPLFAAATQPAQAQAQTITDPAEIDQAVAQFTGFSIGEVGGARVPADRRLRLAACTAPLDVAWYGRNQSTLQVSCAGPESWRIFIATRPAPQSTVAAGPIVSRGDPITVQFRGRGFSVQHTGEAMDNGGRGDWITVRTSRDAVPIRARIERAGFAVIPAG